METCRGTLNPADIGTRGMTVFQLLKSEWLTGPAWLHEPPDTWPGSKPTEEPYDTKTAFLNQLQKLQKVTQSGGQMFQSQK